MEDDIKAFLIKVANSIALVLLWMIINVLFGLYFRWAYVFEKLHWQNLVFYAWCIVSLILLIIYLYRKWK
jgi:NADH:ubiquinone oxidoreductase subunit 3 (subunit A)